MTKELEKINKLIKKTTEEISTFNNSKKDLLKQKAALEKRNNDTYQKLSDALKDIKSQISALEKKRNKIAAPIYDEIATIEENQREIENIINTGESKSKSLAKMQKIKTILEKIDAGYFIIIADRWGGMISLGKFYRNNYRPDGWYIVDIFIKGTSVYCQSNIAQNPRKLFDLLTEFRWTITLTNSLKPMSVTGGRFIKCPKCGNNDAVTSKVCPVCKTEDREKSIEYTCRNCGYIVDCSSDDKHKFSDNPETFVVKSE